jgi:organic radical activating enzyme
MSEFYCPLAWGSVALRNNGDFRLCCHANISASSGILRDERGTPLNIATTSVDQIQNHPDLLAVRQSFLKDEWPAACVRCQTEEEAGLKSGRSHALQRVKNEKLEEEFLARLKRTQADGRLDSAAIVEMDVRFGNLCNLKCRSCGPTDSSSWYGDWVQLGNEGFQDSGIAVKFTNDSGRVVASPDRFQWIQNVSIDSILPEDARFLRRIYLAGGEPLIIPKHKEFLQALVDRGLAQQIYLEYNTNLTQLPQAILELWKQFRAVGVGISLDGVGKYHEYLRYPARQTILEKNLALLDEQPKHIRAWFACTVSWMNLPHLPDFLLWVVQKNFCKIGRRNDRLPISFHLLHKPLHLNLQAIPSSAKEFVTERVREKWAGMQELFSPEDQRLFSEFLSKTIRYMNRKDESALWPQHLEKNLRLDSLRGQSFGAIDPTLAQVLGYPQQPSLRPEQAQLAKT